MGLANRVARPAAAAVVADEGLLLARARQGDTLAFEALVQQHQRRAYGVALRIVRSHDVADDVAQETFVRAWRSLDRFQPGRPFAPWICRIAANLAVNHVRSPRSREQALPEEREDPSAAPDPLATVLDAEASRVLDEAVAALPAEQRAVLVLRVFEEMSYDEIGRSLGLRPGTVMSRLYRARERLAQALEPYLGASARRTRTKV